MRLVYYHCTTGAQQSEQGKFLQCPLLPLLQWQDTNPRSRDYEACMLPLCNESTTQWEGKDFAMFFFVLVSAAVYKPLILGSWDLCTNYVLLTHNQVRCKYFSLAMVPVARYKPLILGLSDKCSATVLSQPSEVRRVFSIFWLAPVSSGKILTHKLRIMSLTFYYCTRQAQLNPQLIGFWVGPSTAVLPRQSQARLRVTKLWVIKLAREPKLHIYKYLNPYRGTLIERDDSVQLTSLDQATLMRRSTVLGLSLQSAFPALT